MCIRDGHSHICLDIFCHPCVCLEIQMACMFAIVAFTIVTCDCGKWSGSSACSGMRAACSYTIRMSICISA